MMKQFAGVQSQVWRVASALFWLLVSIMFCYHCFNLVQVRVTDHVLHVWLSLRIASSVCHDFYEASYLHFCQYHPIIICIYHLVFIWRMVLINTVVMIFGSFSVNSSAIHLLIYVQQLRGMVGIILLWIWRK